MGISIRDPEVGELARELANLRKTNMTEAIAHALRASWSASAQDAASSSGSKSWLTKRSLWVGREDTS